MNITPKRNLSDQAEPWGRSVDQRIADLEGSLSKYQQDTNNALKGINSTTTKLSEQVEAIDLLTQELASQQNLLETQQAQLSAQVTQIAALVNSQVYPVSAHVQETSIVIPQSSSNVTVARTEVAVPSGYTRALVYVSVVVNGFNNGPTTDNLYCGAVINGSSIGFANRISTLTGNIGSAVATSTALITPLGSTLEIKGTTSSDFASWTSPGQNNVNLDTMVIFLR